MPNPQSAAPDVGGTRAVTRDRVACWSDMWKPLSVSELAALAVGLLYVSGYYIHSVFVRNLGIAPTELVRLEYITIGFAFMLITFGFVLLPLGAFVLTYNVRRSSHLPHYHSGAIGNSLNTTLFFVPPIFFAFFVTRYEWDYVFPFPIVGLRTFKAIAIACLGLSFVGMAIVPSVERLIVARTGERARQLLYRFLVEPLRFGILIATVCLLSRSLAQIPWMKQFIIRGMSYFSTEICFVGGMIAAALWIRHIRGFRLYWLVYGLLGCGITLLYYLAVTSYVFAIYPFIPQNRGGRLPLTRAYLEITGHDKLFPDQRIIGGTKVYGPAYIIDENDHSFFVASQDMDKWLTGFVSIHVIRKEDVPYMYLERIDDGFPRAGQRKQ